MSVLRRHRAVLRLALLLMLALGLVARPLLAQIGALHGDAHAVAALAHGDAGGDGDGHAHAHDAHGHAHDHSHVGNPDAGADQDRGDAGDPDHALGAHGLLHQTCGLTVGMPALPVQLALPSPPAASPPDVSTPRLRADPSSFPFRPPIA
jgi:hypothetical protein